MSAFLLQATRAATLAALYGMFAYLLQTFIWPINLAVSRRVFGLVYAYTRFRVVCYQSFSYITTH